MAISANTVWEVRTTGADTNGGGVNSATVVIDYSQQASPQVSVTDAVTAGTTTITSATATFTANMVGNLLAISGGTGSIALAWYEIVTFTNSTSIVVDRSTGLSVGTGATLKVGGALASPGAPFISAVGGNYVWVKAGTYSITSASTNISGGCVSMPTGTTARSTRLSGYNSSRGDRSTPPLLQASGISTFILVKGIAGGVIENISVDGATLTSSQGINIAASGTRCALCKAVNCTNSGFVGAAGSLGTFCEATTCSTAAAFLTGNWSYCTAHDNTFTGFSTASSGMTLVRCLSVNNTGATSDGFIASAMVGYANCVAYNNGRNGFGITSLTGQISYMNCVAEGNGQSSGTGTGFTASATMDGAFMLNCSAQAAGASAFNNKTAGISANIPALNQVGTITPTASVFTTPGSNDFSLNTNASAGAALRAAGVPSTTPWIFGGLSTNSFLDVGAAQHADPTATAFIYNIME